MATALILSGCSGASAATADPTREPAPTAAATPTPAPIPSTVIIDAYAADQAAADAQYRDQTLLISGHVTNINDVFGVMALLLRESEDEVGLQCYLTDNADAEKVNVGDDIVIRGTLQGGELGFFMVAEDCAVVSP